jgi:hypothetical protein
VKIKFFNGQGKSDENSDFYPAFFKKIRAGDRMEIGDKVQGKSEKNESEKPEIQHSQRFYKTVRKKIDIKSLKKPAPSSLILIPFSLNLGYIFEELFSH